MQRCISALSLCNWMSVGATCRGVFLNAFITPHLDLFIWPWCFKAWFSPLFWQLYLKEVVSCECARGQALCWPSLRCRSRQAATGCWEADSCHDLDVSPAGVCIPVVRKRPFWERKHYESSSSVLLSALFHLKSWLASGHSTGVKKTIVFYANAGSFLSL